MIRAIVTSCVEGVIKRLSAMGMIGISNREYLQHYGFTSIPKPGAEVILVADGNHIVAIASDDRRYRLAISEGEVALYDDRGQAVHLTSTGIVMTSPFKVTIDTPLLIVTGEITAGGEIVHLADTTPQSMSGMIGKYNGHKHGGSTPPTSSERM